jgi:2-oxoisovalerate dehydrogenase E1 component beta subunit
LGGEIAATISEEAFEYLDGPIVRVTAPDTPVPFSSPLEEFFLPKTTDLLQAARRLAAY